MLLVKDGKEVQLSHHKEPDLQARWSHEHLKIENGFILGLIKENICEQKVTLQ